MEPLSYLKKAERVGYDGVRQVSMGVCRRCFHRCDMLDRESLLSYNIC